MKTRILIVSIALLTTSYFAYAQQRGSERSGEKKEKAEVKAAKPERSAQSNPSRRSEEPRKGREPSHPANVNRAKSPEHVQQPARVPENRESTSISRQQNDHSSWGDGNHGTSHRSSGNDPVYRGEPAVKQRQPANQGTIRRADPESSHSTHGRKVEPGQREIYTSERHMVYSRPVRHSYSRIPETRMYRSVHYPYRPPVVMNILWNVDVFHYYSHLYPVIGYWDYDPYYTVYTISAYDAFDHIGHIRRVYGQVYETYYFPDADQYFLYIGAYYPYQDFTVILPGHIARRFSWNPEHYFENAFIEVTGLITEFDGKPEMEIRSRSQLDRY
jgi:hypothetical protein